MMRRASFLVPLKDNAGVPFTDAEFEWLRDALLERYEGFTRDSAVDGQWYTAGKEYADRWHRYVVTLPDTELDGLQVLLEEVCARFRQESLYVEVAGVDVRLIEPGE